MKYLFCIAPAMPTTKARQSRRGDLQPADGEERRAAAAEELLDKSDKKELETVKRLVAKKLKIVESGSFGGVTGEASTSSGSRARLLQA